MNRKAAFRYTCGKEKGMAKEKAIINRFDGAVTVTDKYESKYFKYLGNVRQSGASLLDAFKSQDIASIETAIKHLADSIRNHIILIGLGCVIIDREGLYAKAGYNSYLEYAKHLYGKTGLSPQSISAAKIIMERFIDYNAELMRHGFDIERNSNKLLHLENALLAHRNRDDVFKHICNDTYRDFLDYARSGNSRRALPPPVPQIRIAGGRILVDGKDFDSLPAPVKKTVEHDFSEVCSIRAAGNAPVITPVYDEREARTLKNKIDQFLKEMRAAR
jgi:hypothetical protein